MSAAFNCVDGDAEEASTMTRTGELILIAVSVSVFFALIISQTNWTRGHDKPAPLQQHDQIVLTETARADPLPIYRVRQ